MKGLSQCMIVKNEEKHIRRALSWAADIADEQIVVDTGSTDRTVEIARSMGAKVFHFPWEDDFSAAKNYAISQASGSWIAFLDADEYFNHDEAQKIPDLLGKLSPEKIDGVMVSMMQLDAQGEFFAGGTQVRFFANRGNLRYRRRIHEQLFCSDGRPLLLRDSSQELCIFHTGYMKEEGLQDIKSQRNFRLIRRELEEHPRDHEMLGYLGDMYFAAGQMEEAKNAYCKAINELPKQTEEGDQRSAVTFLNMIRIADQTDETEFQVKEILTSALSRKELCKDADFDYLMARWYLTRQHFDKALPYLLKTVEKLEKYGNFGRAIYAAPRLQEICEQTALCWMKEGNLNEAVRQSTAVLKADPWSFLALCVLMESFHSGKVEAGQAYDFLSRFYDVSSLKSRIFLLRAAKQAKWGELEKKLYGLLSREELACFERSVEKKD